MISAFVRVNENRKKLVEDLEAQKLTPQESYELAKSTVLDYQENQLAFQELLHYQEHGKILGKHPIFEEDNLREDIENMSDVEAFKLYNNMASQISRARKKLKANPKDQNAKADLQRKETKRELLQKKLNEKQIL